MVELEQLERIDRYLQVLIEAYPTPLNQTQIAQKAEVSKAAVSQIRDHLYEICDIKTMIYKKKLVLKSDNETIFNLFAYFFYAHDALNLQEIISYEYFNIVKFSDLLYDYIADQNKEYEIKKYLTKGEFGWIVNFVKNKILHYEILFPEDEILLSENEFLDEPQDVFTMDDFYEYLPFEYMTTNWVFLKNALLEKDISFLHKKDDFIMLLTLRDKIHSFILKNIDCFDPFYDDIIKYLEVKNKNEMEEIYKAYHHIIKLFSKKILKSFTEIVFMEIDRQKIEINNKFKTIGSLFK